MATMIYMIMMISLDDCDDHFDFHVRRIWPSFSARTQKLSVSRNASKRSISSAQTSRLL